MRRRGNARRQRQGDDALTHKIDHRGANRKELQTTMKWLAAKQSSGCNRVSLTQPRKIKPSSKAKDRRIAPLDQNLKPTNSVDNAIVTTATGTIGSPK
jgi:hypothetical protein